MVIFIWFFLVVGSDGLLFEWECIFLFVRGEG